MNGFANDRHDGPIVMSELKNKERSIILRIVLLCRGILTREHGRGRPRRSTCWRSICWSHSDRVCRSRVNGALRLGERRPGIRRAYRRLRSRAGHALDVHVRRRSWGKHDARKNSAGDSKGKALGLPEPWLRWCFVRSACTTGGLYAGAANGVSFGFGLVLRFWSPWAIRV